MKRLTEWGGLLVAVASIAQMLFIYLTHSQYVTDTYLFPLGNPSMTGTFISLALIGSDFELVAWVAAALIARSTPLLILTAYRLPLTSILAGIVLLVRNPGGTGRVAVWRFYFDWWRSLPAHFHWVGIGWGQTKTVLPRLQLLDALTHGVSHYSSFEVLHNDFLQALIELGYVGFTLFTGFTIYLFAISTRKHRRVGFAYLAGMATNFPWHVYPHVVLYWLWIIGALRGKRAN